MSPSSTITSGRMPLEASLIERLGAPGQPASYLDGLVELYQRDVGWKMLTLMTFDDVGAVASRVYTTDPANYPVSGRKAMTGNGWTEQVLHRQEVFVANTHEEFRPHYTDWEKLRDLGYGAAVNFPVVVDGHTVGTVNLVAEAGFYAPQRVQAGVKLTPMAAVGFLLLAQQASLPPRFTPS